MKQKNYPLSLKKIFAFSLAVLLTCLLSSCGTGGDIQEKEPLISDPVIQHVFDARDQKDSDSLQKFFQHPEADVRALAAESFASVLDSSAMLALNNLLVMDESAQVREAAAFSLGMLHDSTASELLFSAYQVENIPTVRKTILEALGRGISQMQLPRFYNLETIDESDLEGQAWGFYRSAMRGVYDNASGAKMISYLAPENSFDTRLAAAHFFARGRFDPSPFRGDLSSISETERSPEVLMQIASTLGKIEEPIVLEVLERLSSHSDYRVRVNAYRALAGLSDEVSPVLISGLMDSQLNVAIACAEGIATKPVDLMSLPLDSMNWRVRTTLISSVGDNPELAIEYYKKSINPFEKAGLMSAVAKDLSTFEFIVNETFQSDDIIKSRGMGALLRMRLSSDFPEELHDDFDEILMEAIQSGDPVLQSGAFRILREDTLSYRDKWNAEDFIPEARTKISHPNSKELLDAMEGYFKTGNFDRGYSQHKPTDWDHFKDLEDEEIIVITTSKGRIRLRLFTSEAPASVINFLQLIERGFFNDTYWHRVVPNFVIQAGSDLGDGSGGPDYSIRTEITQRKYGTGTLGMASAGADTEGSQFFITHSPTPHLDGGIFGQNIQGYTTFGEILEGMEVVHQIEVGDHILRIERE